MKIKELQTRGLGHKEDVPKYQIFTTNFYFLVATATTSFLGVVLYFVYNREEWGIFILGVLGVVLLNFIFYKLTLNYKAASWVMLVLGLTVMWGLFYNGPEKIGLIWPFAWLPTTFWTVKGKQGRSVMAIFISGCIILCTLDFFDVIDMPYTVTSLVNFYAAILAFTAIMILNQNSTLIYRQKMIEARSALTELNGELEQKVQDRTEELQLTMAKLNKAQKVAHLGSWELDFTTGKATWSEESCRIYGMDVKDNVHTFDEWFSYIHPDDMAMVSEIIKESEKSLSTSRMYHRILRRDGVVRYLYSESIFQFDEHGNPKSLYGIAHDITEHRKAQLEIEKLNANLEKKVEERTAELTAVNKELESFSYSVSHDLRAPIRAVDGYARILMEDFGEELDGEAIRVIGKITKNAKKMGDLIDDLLAFSRLGRKELVKASVDVQGLVEELCAEIEREQKISIDFQIGDLPPAIADKATLKQVWTNLISNAAKYSQNGDAPVVEIGSYKENGENVYFVKDNGVGFNMEYSDKLFGVFQRLHSEEEFEGTGVGLAIVQRIINRHGGRIWANGVEGEGAEFYFVI